VASRSLPLLTLVTGAALLALFHWGIYQRGPWFAVSVVFLACSFLGTILSLEVGIAVLVLSMLLSPELTVGDLATRGLTLRLEDLMIPVVLLAWTARKALGLERRELRHDPILALMALFVAIQVVASLLGSGRYGLHLATSFLYIVKGVEYFAIFFFAFQWVDTARRVRALLVLAILTAAVTAVYNVFRIPGNAVWTSHRISAPFEGNPEPSSIGGYFVLVLALLLAFYLEAPGPRLRRWLLGVAAVIFLPFLYTLSRTSYVAFLAMVVVIALLRRSRRLLLVLLVGLALSPFLLPDSVVDRVLYTFNARVKVLGYFDHSFGERIYIWRKVAWNLRQAPLLGQGVTSHNVIDSYYARVLIETGVLGLVAFLAIVGRLLVIASRVRRRHRRWWARALALGYTAGLLALLVHSFSAITFVIVRIMEPFWLVSGTLAGLAHPLARSDGGDDDDDPSEGTGPWTTSSADSAS
jgi:hypothetical protein